MRRRRLVGRARLLAAAHGLFGAALPVAGAGERRRIAAADADMGEMRRRRRRIVEEPQRDPARGELLFGLVDVARRQCRVAGHQIGGAVVAVVEQLAGEQPPLHPPFVDVDQPCRFARRLSHQLRGLRVLLFAPQLPDAAEQVARIVAQFVRYGIEQRLLVVRLAIAARHALASAT